MEMFALKGSDTYLELPDDHIDWTTAKPLPDGRPAPSINGRPLKDGQKVAFIRRYAPPPLQWKIFGDWPIDDTEMSVEGAWPLGTVAKCQQTGETGSSPDALLEQPGIRDIIQKAEADWRARVVEFEAQDDRDESLRPQQPQHTFTLELDPHYSDPETWIYSARSRSFRPSWKNRPPAG